MTPTRRLTDQVKPHRYVPSATTDVRRTWRKFRLLAYFRSCSLQPKSP